MQEIIATKVLMTNVFNEKHVQVPVTVVLVPRGRILQIKTKAKDGYETLQVGFYEMKEKRVNRPLLGFFKSCNSPALKLVKELRTSDISKYKVGDEMGIEVLEGVRFVDVQGTSKGRGFAGTIKRHNFQRGRETHGNKNHREPGSVGQHTFPARVFPGKRMAGHLGDCRVTTRNVRVVEVIKDKGLVVLEGCVPGPYNGTITLKKVK